MAGSTEVSGVESVAEWRLNPACERESREFRRAVRSRRANGWFLGLVAISCCPAMLIQTVAEDGGLLTTFVVFFSLFALSTGLVRRTGRRVSLGEKRRERFRAEHDPVGGWLVDMSVLQGSVPTGRDVGVVWFEDERLYFLGNRTSFGLARGQVATIRFDDWLPNDLQSAITLTLGASTPVGRLGVGFEVISQPPNAFRSDRGPRALEQSLRGWMARSQGEEGQLPPLTIGPDAPNPLALLKGAVKTSLVWSAAAAFLLWVAFTAEWWYAPPLGFVILLLFAPWGAVWIPRLRWRAWYDRRRLDRSASQ